MSINPKTSLLPPSSQGCTTPQPPKTCPKHKPSTIISGSGSLKVNGKPVACVGDTVGCGATIVEGTALAMSNGKLVAYVGAKTSHGGVIVSGDSSLMVDV